jgi:hypothetical protein
MAATRILSSTNGCRNCHYRLLNAFVSLAGPGLRSELPSQLPKSKLIGQRIKSARSFTSSRFRPALTQENIKQEEEGLGARVESSSATSKESVTVLQQTDDSTPWYLQIQPPVTQERTLPDRQKLPDLPENPPLLLQPIIEYLSIDAGLDDLTLLDVRKLDPPPALGANLIMLIGTARSEKHLHVSADRFARWLRTTHKLSPYADGLLGRNELKIKLRRKARRAKLLGSVGSTDKENDDDGIRTGWVCVNVGTIEEGNQGNEEQEMAQNFVGFSSHADGARLVVQMLTEEKREELDLETLWGQALSRQQRKEAREAEKRLEEAGHHEVGHNSLSNTQSIADTSLSAMSSLPLRSPSLSKHSRRFHSSAKSSNTPETKTEPTAGPEGPIAQNVEPSVVMAGTTVPTVDPVELAKVKKQTAFWKSERDLTIKALLEQLKSLDKDDAIRALGIGANDYTSTPFLRSFYSSFSILPSFWELQSRFNLVCYALSIGHSRYSRRDVLNALREIQCSSTEVHPRLYRRAMRVILGDPSYSVKNEEFTPTSSPSSDIALMLDILSDMSLRGHDILDEHALLTLLRILPRAQGQDTTTASEVREYALWRLIDRLDKKGIVFRRSSTHYFILDGLAAVGNWDGFWKYWRGIVRRNQRRSFMLYALMFRYVAMKGDQTDCASVLTRWSQEMKLEEPAVPMKGVLATAFLECLRVAYPDRIADGTYQIPLSEICQEACLLENEISTAELDDGLLDHFNRLKAA